MHKVRKFDDNNMAKFDGLLHFLFKRNIPYSIRVNSPTDIFVSWYDIAGE